MNRDCWSPWRNAGGRSGCCGRGCRHRTDFCVVFPDRGRVLAAVALRRLLAGLAGGAGLRPRCTPTSRRQLRRGAWLRPGGCVRGRGRVRGASGRGARHGSTRCAPCGPVRQARGRGGLFELVRFAFGALGGHRLRCSSPPSVANRRGGGHLRPRSREGTPRDYMVGQFTPVWTQPDWQSTRKVKTFGVPGVFGGRPTS